jgi:hypothetical protein
MRADDVLVEHRSFRFGPEEQLVIGALHGQGQTYATAAASQLMRNRLDSSASRLVVGGLDFIKYALRQRGLQLPAESCYPDCLSHLLYREVGLSTLGKVMDRVLYRGPVFVKPALRTKRFTGLVLRESDDYRLGGIPRSESVYHSEVVQWLSEWRCYVVGQEVLFKACYAGNGQHVPDPGVVTAAVSLMAQQANAPRGYAIDFGVLICGRTALVECNDGFSIGAYGDLPGDIYLAMLQARWDQLVGTVAGEA